MARKNILQGLLNPDPLPATPAATGGDATPPAPATPHVAPRSTKGAIGAVSRSIADLKARSVIEIDPFMIDAGGLQDRLESDAEEDAELARSIAEYGQQVPVLVRPHPDKDGRYQIVYGRRRVLAMRDLNLPVKALVRELDDTQLILAQGQENTARRDLSFIEKVNFARQMEDAGYSRKVICDALSIDKTLISRMLSISDRVPTSILTAFGSLHGVGRDRWLEFAQLVEQLDVDEEWLNAMMVTSGLTSSAEVFAYLMDRMGRYITDPASRPAAPKASAVAERKVAASVIGDDGEPLGEMRRMKTALILKLNLNATKGFEDWLLSELPRLHADWRAGQGQD